MNNTDSEYFSFKKMLKKHDNLKYCNYSGWSGLEFFKFFLSKGEKLSNEIVLRIKPELSNKEKIFFSHQGKLKFVDDNNAIDLIEYDVINHSNNTKFYFQAKEDSEFYMISSLKSSDLNKKTKILNILKDVEKRNLWGGNITSRPYEGHELTLVLFELKANFKFEDNGHPNQQITFLTSGEMEFYTDDKKKLLNSSNGVSIGPNHSHGGFSKGAIGFDAFFPKRIESKYINK